MVDTCMIHPESSFAKWCLRNTTTSPGSVDLDNMDWLDKSAIRRYLREFAFVVDSPEGNMRAPDEDPPDYHEFTEIGIVAEMKPTAVLRFIRGQLFQWWEATVEKDHEHYTHGEWRLVPGMEEEDG